MDDKFVKALKEAGTRTGSRENNKVRFQTWYLSQHGLMFSVASDGYCVVKKVSWEVFLATKEPTSFLFGIEVAATSELEAKLRSMEYREIEEIKGTE